MSTQTEIRFADVADLKRAYENSWYLIAGTGGDLQEWVDGYNGLLAEQEIGQPINWFKTNGATINAMAGAKKGGLILDVDQFPGDLVCLLFPLDDMHVGRLAIFKIRMEDRWFDDVINNMRRAR